MVKEILIGLGATAILGFAILPTQDKVPDKKVPTSAEPGALMAAGYDAVFNDLELLWKYGPGAISRVRNNPFDSHSGFRKESEITIENELLKSRA